MGWVFPILSTSKGVMSDVNAREANVGGKYSVKYFNKVKNVKNWKKINQHTG